MIIQVSSLKRNVKADGKWMKAAREKSSSVVAVRIQFTCLNKWFKSICLETDLEVPPVLVKGSLIFQTGISSLENCCGCLNAVCTHLEVRKVFPVGFNSVTFRKLLIPYNVMLTLDMFNNAFLNKRGRKQMHILVCKLKRVLEVHKFLVG